MGIYDALFSAIFNMLSIYIDVRMLKLFLPVRVKESLITMPVYIGVWLVNWLIFYFFNTPNLTTCSMIIGLLVVAVVIFYGNFWKKVLAVIVINASGIIAENIVWKLSIIFLASAGSAAVGGLCSVILKFLIILVIERCVSLDRYAKLTKAGYINIILVSVGSVILSEVITLYHYTNDLTMICLSIICMINVSTYYMYEKIAEAWEDRLKNAEMEQQIRMYANQFDIIGQSCQNIKSLRHDMKNHMALISIYLQNKQYEKACAYVETLGECLKSEKEYVKTGNIEIDSILNYKLENVEKKFGYKPDVQIDVPEQSFMSGFDLNVLLSNLLDNAVEAISKVENKFLSIRIRFSRGILYISIYNTFSGKLCERAGRLVSTKSNTKNHGIGLENVRKIVEKFEGTMKIEHDDELFKIDIILFLETAKI